jgi:hypothetical protein
MGGFAAGDEQKDAMDTFDAIKRRMVDAGLNRLYAQARRRSLMMNFDPGYDKLVCVSDLHRGRRDGADDFRRTERVYNAALAWYHDNGYQLAVLGDAEDLWESSPKAILGCTDPAAKTGYVRAAGTSLTGYRVGSPRAHRLPRRVGESA